MYNSNYATTALGYKVEEKIYVGVRERKRMNITDLHGSVARGDTQYGACASCNNANICRLTTSKHEQ